MAEEFISQLSIGGTFGKFAKFAEFDPSKSNTGTMQRAKIRHVPSPKKWKPPFARRLRWLWLCDELLDLTWRLGVRDERL